MHVYPSRAFQRYQECGMKGGGLVDHSVKNKTKQTTLLHRWILQGQVVRSFCFRVQKNSQVATKFTSTSLVSMPFKTYDYTLLHMAQKENVENKKMNFYLLNQF